MKVMVRVCGCLLLLVGVLASAAAVLAKGEPDKVTITGPGVAAPLEITDAGLLGRFDPLDGQFLDVNRTVAPDAPQDSARYQVLFYSKNADGAYHLFYAFYSLPEPSGMRGLIYLPQEKEQWYDMNTYTIARRSGWLYASPAWDAFMQNLLSEPRSSAGSLISPVAGAAALVFISAGAMALWTLRRRARVSA